MTSPKPLRFLEEAQPCRRCGLPTVTLKVGGRIPLHVTCDPRAWFEDDLEITVAAIHAVADQLGPLSMVEPEELPPTAIDEIGPCTSCGHPTRRYGIYGAARCHRCDPGGHPMRFAVQDPLFPVVECACGHRDVVTLEEVGCPCPRCIEGASPHDCPELRIEASR